ncbi:hypothetical protein DPMN_074299 [Dreissena polymorpha]|uniref:Uncharacterized protein n=1 Tax=Dreissena polymorpha TaxID=45954 RepID=A0A9D3YJG7_DREPO|nr:hypothetical protein DPMN_074299 [Dreissena polymorpha]
MATYSPTVDIDPGRESKVESGGQSYPGYPMPMFPGMHPGRWQPGHPYPSAWMRGPGSYMYPPMPPIPQGYGATPQVVQERAQRNDTPLRPDTREGAQGARRNIAPAMVGNMGEQELDNKGRGSNLCQNRSNLCQNHYQGAGRLY